MTKGRMSGSLRFMTRTLALVFAMAFFSVGTVNADEETWRHGDTLFGELKYGPEVKHYAHVNPDAPKGGTLNEAAFGGFDTFNPFVAQGRPAAGLTYFGGLLYDTLFEQSVDQPSASYGLVADGFRKADDSSWAIYRINENARWHDGKPITVDDVIWSMEKLREVDPRWSSYFKNVTKTEIIGEREVKFSFDITGNRELPHIIGDLVVLPKHWWEGTDADGNKRDITKPTSEPPLGSGPYRIGKFDLGKAITWQRVEDYWAVDHPMRKGRYNFDEIKYTYFLDQNAMWEAFKKGGIEDIRRENISRRWNTEYVFPAFKRGDVVKQTFRLTRPALYQAFYFNTRRDKFQDVRVREAISLMLDFETMNKNLFFDSYKRTASYFEGGELAAKGKPKGRELEILEEYRDQLPPELFDQEILPPVLGTNRAMRRAQRRAIALLTEAGYAFKDGKTINAAGQQLQIEILGNSQTDEVISLPLIENLSKIGIKGDLRIVDTSQYQARVDKFDFDMLTSVTLQSLSPGNEQREYWSSVSADRVGTRNLSGIKEPLIDELVEKIIVAPDREELVALTHALDRILRWRHYTIPLWHNADEWYAMWKKIQVPEPQPGYTGFDVYSAWIDTAIEQQLEGQ